jgi:hypothetical protein
MKLLLTITTILLSTSTLALSCDTLENGVRTICNDYSDSGNAEQLKKLCAMGNIGTTKGRFSKAGCNQSNVAAKCVVKSRDVSTYYYERSGLSAEQMEKGCKFFKDGVFTNYSANSKPETNQEMNNVMKSINKNPKLKRYMDCVKKATGGNDVSKCKSFLL